MDEFLGRLEAVARVLRHHPVENLHDLDGQIGHHVARVGGADALVVEQLLRGGALGERRPARQGVVEGAAERVDVAAHVGVARLERLLRRDVVERPQRYAGLRQILAGVPLEAAGEAHIDELGPTRGGNDDVRRLDVAVDDAPAGRVGESGGDLEHVVDGLADGQPAPPLEQDAQVIALDELEGDEVEALVLAAVEDAGDVLVVELGGAAGLLVEAADVFGVDRHLGR